MTGVQTCALPISNSVQADGDVIAYKTSTGGASPFKLSLIHIWNGNKYRILSINRELYKQSITIVTELINE